MHIFKPIVRIPYEKLLRPLIHHDMAPFIGLKKYKFILFKNRPVKAFLTRDPGRRPIFFSWTIFQFGQNVNNFC